MADVFISYSKQRRHLTAALAKHLVDAGFSVWWDTGLLPNQRFRAEIDDQLDACKAAVIVWSPESINSDWVLAEAEHARAQGKLVNTYAPDLNPAAIPKPFNQTHAVALNDVPAIVAAIEELAGLVRRVGWRPPRQQVSRGTWLGLGAAMSAAIIAVAGVVALNAPLRSAAPPVWDLPRNTFVSERALLKWTSATRAGAADGEAASFFVIESSGDESFLDPVEHSEIVNGEYAYISGLNSSRYWRVRAVDPQGKKPPGPWSVATKVSQYDDARTRIKMTGQVLVSVSNSEYQDIFKWIDGNAKLRGLDLVVARAVVEGLAARIGLDTALKPEITPIPWADLLDAPRQGRADLIVSAISKRKSREDSFGLTFSAPYFCTGQSLLHRSSQGGPPIEALVFDASVGYQKSTTSEQLAGALSKDPRFSIKASAFDRTDFVIDALLSSRVSFAIVDTPFAIDTVRSAKVRGLDLAFTEFRENDYPSALSQEMRTDAYAIGIRGGDDILIQDINAILEQLKSTGELGRLFSEEMDAFMKIKPGRVDPRTESRVRASPWQCPS